MDAAICWKAFWMLALSVALKKCELEGADAQVCRRFSPSESIGSLGMEKPMV